jgi:hypothetical protein
MLSNNKLRNLRAAFPVTTMEKKTEIGMSANQLHFRYGYFVMLSVMEVVAIGRHNYFR